jgi:peptide/nickel transport system permease protein
MLAFVVRRLALTAITVVSVSFGAFCAFGKGLDPSYPLVLDPDPENRRAVQAYYHLTDPIFSRYWRWVKDFFQHGFGNPVSLQVADDHVVTPSTTSISGEVLHAGWISFQLVGFSLVLMVLLSLALGTVSARWRSGPADIALRLVTYVSWSVPAFLVAFFFRRWFTSGQTASSFTYGPQTIEHQGSPIFLIGPPTSGFVNWFQHMTLPALALALGVAAVYVRYVRSSMLVSLGQSYAVVARAKGLSEGRVVVRHALRNSLIPFVSALSLEVGAVVGASLAADWVFSMGGVASLTIGALGRADPFELTAVVITIALVVIVFMTIADLVVGWLDPRVRVVGAR